MCISPQRHAIFRHLNRQKWSKHAVFCTFWLSNVLFATAACNFSTSEQTKPSCFVHFDFQMCFSPQRRAFFRHLNFKKWSRIVSFLTFSLPNVLFATAAYNFSTSELQEVLRTRHVLYIFTSKCAFRHSGVQFLISPLSSYLRTRRFNRPTFGLTRRTNHWKNTAFRDFSNIWRGCIFFLLTFALLHLLSADLALTLLQLLSTDLTTLLCFSTVHIVGSFYLNFLRLYFPTFGWSVWSMQANIPYMDPMGYRYVLSTIQNVQEADTDVQWPLRRWRTSKYFSVPEPRVFYRMVS